MEEILNSIYEWFKKFSPFILVGIVGAIVHRVRSKQTKWKGFGGAMFISILVSLSVGVVASEYTHLKDGVIYILCGISGTFSQLILNELEEAITDLSEAIKARFGVRKDKEQNDKNVPDNR